MLLLYGGLLSLCPEADDGVLLYSTCTINPQENKENTRWLLKSDSEFKLCAERQMLQGVDQCDGFYYAVLQRG